MTGKYLVTKYRKRLAALMMILPVAWAGALEPLWAEDAQRSFSAALLKFQTQSLDKGQFRFSLAPCYYKDKTDEAEWYSTAVIFRAYVAHNLEFAVGTDLPSYQRPDFGVGDIYTGMTWTFYDAHLMKLAVSAHLNFPTGSPAFRNPGLQPSFALTAIKSAGAFDFGLSVGTTYAADAQGEPCYFDVETTFTVDYTPDDKNAFGIFACGYAPDQRQEGLARLSGGASYTRTFTDRYAASVTLEKGLSGRGLDWSVTLGFDFTF